MFCQIKNETKRVKKNKKTEGIADFPPVAVDILPLVRASCLIRHVQESVIVLDEKNERAD